MLLNSYLSDRNTRLNILKAGLILLLLVAIWLNTSGCLTQKILIRQSLTPIPEEAQGALYVIQDKKIMVGVEGTNHNFKINAQGYYLVHKNDLTAMIKIINKKEQ